MFHMRRYLLSSRLYRRPGVERRARWGSSIGFHEYLKHRHSEAIVLPRLYEPQPGHVPELSDKALIKLWETNQFSPILRNPAIERQLYEAVSQWRGVNTARWDAAHPTLGHMLSDPQLLPVCTAFV